jgi:2-haloacid dehalogenase
MARHAGAAARAMPPAVRGTEPQQETGAVTVEAFLFDVFGTCVDWRNGIAREVGKLAAEKNLIFDNFAFADGWRALYQPRMEEIRSGRREYADLDVLHRENLDAVLEAFGLAEAFNEEERATLNGAWEKLPPWPDAVAGLEGLKAGAIVAACSNGSIAMMTRLAKYGRLPWDCILGAGLARAYKPDPRAYLTSCEALRLAPDRVMMVAAHNDDLAAARACGLKTAFVVRAAEHGPGQTDDLTSTSDWDMVAPDFIELARGASRRQRSREERAVRLARD